MKHRSIKYFTFLFFLFLFISSITGQNSDELWSKSSESESSNSRKIERKSMPKDFGIYQLNLSNLNNKLSRAPKRKGNLGKSSIILSFPNEKGQLEKFQVFEASIMEESLQRKYPTIKSYVGKSIENPGSTIRISKSNFGFHGMILQSNGEAIFIDPYTANKKAYLVYNKKNLPTIEPFVCKFEEVNNLSKNSQQYDATLSARAENANDGNLRTFRMAIATTGEYSQFHINRAGINASETDEVKKSAILSAINATMTRVNAIFEKDVGLRMILVDNNTDIIFLDAATDGFTNDDGSVLIDESQSIIDANIGQANYDIGHTFSTGGGGRAQLNSPCTTSKAKGITGSGSPIGDSYDIDFVAHEIGHQFGAHHTFNSDAGGCANGNRNDGTAVEPGSGSTIMAYAGLCAPYNVQPNSDSYFHLVSIREMWANISEGNSVCGVQIATGNTAPVLDVLANYTIPVSTPFVLNANASDINGDELTYTWEQLDTEITVHPLVSTAIGGPLFRSLSPNSSSMRYFPAQRTVNSGNLSSTWEVLPSVGRSMTFGVTVRDNNLTVGQTASEETKLTIEATSGPFKMTSQTAPEEIWYVGTSQTITWDVANTNVSPVSCLFVNILLSTDGGLTYPIVLASNVQNDGSQEIVVPNNLTDKGRIKVESVGNVFYTINDANVNIQMAEFVMNFDSYSKTVCEPNDAVFNFTYNTFLSFNESTLFSATGNPTGTTIVFNPSSAINDGTAVEMTISGIDVDDVENYTISVTGTSASVVKNTVVNLDVFSSTLNTPNLILPENNAVDVLVPYSLNWENDVNVSTYSVEISTDNTFATINETSPALNTNVYIPESLLPNTIYFWRVKGNNDCGTSNYSPIFKFTTAPIICDSDNSADTPLNIPDNNATGVTSIINITNNKTINDINVTVNITHPWIGDLTLTLISPNGTSVILVTSRDDEGDNYTNTVFDDDAIATISSGSAPYTGSFIPQGSLSNFNKEESYGEWVLKIVDSGPEDIGQIDNWSIEICGSIVNGNDDDKDGVLNIDDLCPNTPLNSVIDTNGCPIFSLPSNNFEIEAVGETCPNKENGQIKITAVENYNYTTTIDGIEYNFTDSITTLDLAPGTYDFCIEVEGQTYEQCYVIVIESGTEVGGKVSLTSNKASVEIVEGTAPFIVYLNKEEKFKTTSPVFSIDVKHGDLVEVKTAVTCEGVYSKKIELLEGIVAYPNPSKGTFEISLPVSQKEVIIELYTVHSQLISVKTYPILYGRVQLQLEDQPRGLYIAKVHLDQPVTLKIIKQ
jgi:subtilisin-like proprotein convertase family protein